MKKTENSELWKKYGEKMNRYDVLVVGAGPAGIAAAKYLSERGLRVLIVERKDLPRFKLCGGALSSRFSQYLPMDFRKKVLNTINRGILGFKGKKHVLREKHGVAYIIDRSDFDFFLLEKALDGGVELWEGVGLIDFEKEGGSFIAETTKGKVKIDFIIGADGFYSNVAKKIGYKKEKFYKSIEFTAEGEMDFESVIIEIGLVKRGYLWIFPKGDLLNVGIASTGTENLIKIVWKYLKKQKLVRIKKTYKPKGWFIPFTEIQRDIHLGKDRILLTGDAGNFVDPLLGEGIYYAYLSGIKAGKAIAKNPGNPIEVYKDEVKEMVREFIYAGKIAKLAYNFQKVAFLMGGGESLENYMELLKGNTTYEKLYKSGWVDFLKSFFFSLIKS